MAARPLATARPVFESVSERLGMDADLLAYLFGECLKELIRQAETQGFCTVRGHGKFLQQDLREIEARYAASANRIIVFERSKHIQVNRPFKSLQLKKRLKASNDTDFQDLS